MWERKTNLRPNLQIASAVAIAIHNRSKLVVVRNLLIEGAIDTQRYLLSHLLRNVELRKEFVAAVVVCVFVVTIHLVAIF